MRKVVVGAFVSMDGVMQGPGGPEEDPTGDFRFGGWVAPMAEVDPVFGAEVGKLFDQPFDLLLGRRTYDIFAAHWPYAEGGPYDDIARTFTGSQSTLPRAKAWTSPGKAPSRSATRPRTSPG